MSRDFNYTQAKKELESILDWFESNNHDIDESIEKYKKANELVNQMQKYLKDQEARLKTVTKF